MSAMKIMDILYRLCCWILGIVFIYAGGTKLTDPVVFATLIEAYGLLPEILLLPVAVVLPILEIVGGIGILFDAKGSIELISGLLVLFLLILGYGMFMGLDVDCGCFSPEDPESRAFHGLQTAFFRDLVMAAGIVCAYIWRRYRKKYKLNFREIKY